MTTSEEKELWTALDETRKYMHECNDKVQSALARQSVELATISVKLESLIKASSERGDDMRSLRGKVIGGILLMVAVFIGGLISEWIKK